MSDRLAWLANALRAAIAGGVLLGPLLLLVVALGLLAAFVVCKAAGR